METLADLFLVRGAAGHAPCEAATFTMRYGPEFIAQAVQEWVAAVGSKPAYIAPCNGNPSRRSRTCNRR